MGWYVRGGQAVSALGVEVALIDTGGSARTLTHQLLLFCKSANTLEQGFIWDPKNHADFWKVQGSNKKAEELWEMNFAELNDYKEEFGDCLVPKECVSLIAWSSWVL